MTNTQGAYIVHHDENGNLRFDFFRNSEVTETCAHIHKLSADGTPYRVLVPGVRTYDANGHSVAPEAS